MILAGLLICLALPAAEPLAVFGIEARIEVREQITQPAVAVLEEVAQGTPAQIRKHLAWLRSRKLRITQFHLADAGGGQRICWITLEVKLQKEAK